MSMQMDAYLKKEQFGTLFVWVGAPEGGVGGGVVGQGGPAQKLGVPVQNYLFNRLLLAQCFYIQTHLKHVVLSYFPFCASYRSKAKAIGLITQQPHTKG